MITTKRKDISTFLLILLGQNTNVASSFSTTHLNRQSHKLTHRPRNTNICHAPIGTTRLASNTPSSTRIKVKNNDSIFWPDQQTQSETTIVTNKSPSALMDTSSMHLDQPQDQQQEEKYKNSTLQDVISISSLIVFSLGIAILLSFMEGIDCLYLKQPAAIRNYPTPITTTMNYQQTNILNTNMVSTSSTISSSSSSSNYYTIPIQPFNHFRIPNMIQIMNTGTRGMGRNQLDRLNGWYQNTYYGFQDEEEEEEVVVVATLSTTANNLQEIEHEVDSDEAKPAVNWKETARNIPSYNEIMQHHRDYRVSQWKKDTSSFLQMKTYPSLSSSSTITTTTTNQIKNQNTIQDENMQKVKESTQAVYTALQMIIDLKDDANDYQWDTMIDKLTSPTLTTDLERSCNVLRAARGIIDLEARTEIGFDWGSCAFRHCGAQADAQETIAELKNSIGMFEPFECLFTLDIIERSLRDIIAVVPTKYHPVEGSASRVVIDQTPYVPYQSQLEKMEGDEGGDLLIGGSNDLDFVTVLSKLRNNYEDDDDGSTSNSD